MVAFEFVTSDSHGLPVASERKMIRSHCMRGRNRRKPPVRDLGCQRARVSFDNHREESQLSKTSVPRPRSPPADILLLPFAEDIDTDSKWLIHRFFFTPDLRSAMSPVELRLDMEDSKRQWFDWLFQDAAYVRSIILTASTLQDVHKYRSLSSRTYSRLKQTISKLSSQLKSNGTQLPESTCSVVVTLAIMADALNDFEGVKAHVHGLRQMVLLRGGMASLKRNPKLCLKIFRVDLGWSLRTGEQLLFDDSAEPDLFITAEYSNTSKFDGKTENLRTRAICELLDPQMAAIFRDLHNFCAALNEHFTGDAKLSIEWFCQVAASCQRRLLRLRGRLGSVVAEAMRVGMLAFLLTTSFQVPGQTFRYDYLAARLKESCCAIESSTPLLRQVLLWLLMLTSISVFEKDERWIKLRLLDLIDEFGSWDEARCSLVEVLWIVEIHDEPGRHFFNRLTPERDYN